MVTGGMRKIENRSQFLFFVVFVYLYPVHHKYDIML